MKYRLIIYLFLAALFSPSCEKENNTDISVRHIKFSAAVNAAIDYDVKVTKAYGSKFAVGTHNMGLWICDANNSPILNEFKNCRVEYTRNEDNSESWKFYGGDNVWEDAIPVDDARELFIYSYYPYNENVTDITAVPFASGMQSYFYSEPVYFSDEAAAGDEIEVALNYKPVMTCIEVAIKANVENAIALDEITLTGLLGATLAAKGSYNALTGAVEVTDNERAESLTIQPDEPLLLTTDENTPAVRFVIPKYLNYNENFKLSFKFNGVEGLTEYIIPADIAAQTEGNLNEGKKYIVILQLNEAMKFSNVSFKTINDWNTETVETDIQM